MRVIPFLLAAWGLSAVAQTAGLPRLGWIVEQGGAAVREAVGIPGAAQLNESRTITGIRVLAMRPGRGMALALREDGLPLVGDPESLAAGTGEALDGALGQPDLAQWSPLGQALLLASRGEARMQAWVADGERWRLEREWAMPAESAAISDRGEVLARIDGVLYLLGADGSVQTVAGEAASLFTFLAGGSRYAWVEEGTVRIAGDIGRIAEIPLPERPAAPRLLFSPARGTLVIADVLEERTELALWTEDGVKKGEWICPASVTSVETAGAEGVMHLLSPAEGPVWMASFDREGGRVFFVPQPVAERGDSR